MAARLKQPGPLPSRDEDGSYNGVVDTPFFPVRLRARYAETDQMGIVHHSVYPVWFETARTELSRAVGLPYRAWEEEGVLLVVSELTCRYRSPARYDDEITVLVRVSDVASRGATFSYRVQGGDGRLLAEGTTRHLAVSRATGRPVVLPGTLRAVLRRDSHRYYDEASSAGTRPTSARTRSG